MSSNIGYAPFEFEGALVPGPDGLREGLLDPSDRARLVRAAVVYPPVAMAAIDAARGLLAGDEVAVGLAVVDALGARMLLDELVARLPGWSGAEATHALELVVRLAPPVDPRRVATLRWAMGVPELRIIAWHALGADHPEATLPYLADLLRQAPQLAGAVATRLALVHTEHCLDAARALAELPEATRRAFAADLEKHLKRVFQVRRWAECRRALFGR